MTLYVSNGYRKKMKNKFVKNNLQNTKIKMENMVDLKDICRTITH